MSDSLLSLYGRDSEVHAEDGPLPTLPTRSQILVHLRTATSFDLIILGGGLSGVTIAREAALRGSDVLLVEPGYFGEWTCAWRESIVSFLEKGPTSFLRTVGGVRRVITTIAPHLASFHPWHERPPRGMWGRFGMWTSQRAWRVPGTVQTSPTLPEIDERLLVRETALAARQEGALVVSAATATYVERDSDAGGFRVGVRDLLGADVIEVKAGAIFVDPCFPDPVVSRLGTIQVRRVEGGNSHQQGSRRLSEAGSAVRPRVLHRAGIITSEEHAPWDIYAIAPKILSRVPSCGPVRNLRRPLPGEWRPGEYEAVVSAARAAGLSQATIDLVVQRWKRRARYLLQLERGCEEVCAGVLRGEIALATRSDQVSSLEDLVYGSLVFQEAPDTESLARLSELLKDMLLKDM